MTSKRALRIRPKIDLFIRTASGLILPDERSGAAQIPLDPAGKNLPLTYGDYLGGIAGYFSANSFRRLKDLLLKAAPQAPRPAMAEAIRLIAEKHGALYSVSRLEIRYPSGTSPRGGGVFSFAVNTAFLPEQRAFLTVEYGLLRNLYRRYRLAALPRPYLFGKALIKSGDADFTAEFFAAEWFENHHEFHLSRRSGESRAPLGIRVWKPGHDRLFLVGNQAAELFEGIAGILTAYLDTEDFRQIYPWHHAAGDFVVDESRNPAGVRLITARGYRSLLPPGSDTGYKLLGSLHFFVNLTVRMRIDRLDGTGDLAWAGAEILPGVVRGFAAAWNEKERENPELPEVEELFSFFLGLSSDERLAFSELAAGHGRVEEEEAGFLEPRIPEHVQELSAVIEDYLASAENS